MRQTKKFTSVAMLAAVLLASPLCAASAGKTVQPPAAGGTELEGLENLLSATKLTIESGERLKTDIQQYLTCQAAYLEDPANRDLCFRMVRKARDVMIEIDDSNLTQVFDSEFLSELSLFAEMGKKRGLPQP